MAFSGVKSDGGRPSSGSNKVVILKSIFIGDPGTSDGNCNLFIFMNLLYHYTGETVLAYNLLN